MGVQRERRGRQVDGGDHFAVHQDGVELRLVAGQPVKIRDRHDAVALWSAEHDAGIERGKGNVHVRWVDCNALVAGAEDGVRAVVTLAGAAT